MAAADASIVPAGRHRMSRVGAPIRAEIARRAAASARRSHSGRRSTRADVEDVARRTAAGIEKIVPARWFRTKPAPTLRQRASATT